MITETASTDNAPLEDNIKTNVEFPVDLKTASQDYEISLIKAALKESQFNQKKTAELLTLTYHQLRGYLKKYQLLD